MSLWFLFGFLAKRYDAVGRYYRYWLSCYWFLVVVVVVVAVAAAAGAALIINPDEDGDYDWR